MPTATAAPKRPRRKTGTLVRIKDEGYGFIRPDDGSPDYFVSITSLHNRAHFRENTVVEFTPGATSLPGDGKKSKAPPALDVVAVFSHPPLDVARGKTRKGERS
jgi:cold shock CspA family protein